MSKVKPIEENLIWKGFAKLIEWILFLVSFALAIMVFVTVVVRYIFQSSISGIEEVITLGAVWIYWLGAAYGSYENSHIKADILLNFIHSDKATRIITIIKSAITVFVFGLFTFWAFTQYLNWVFAQGGTTPILKIPQVAMNVVLGISLVLMSIYSVYHLYRAIKPLKNTNEEEEVAA